MYSRSVRRRIYNKSRLPDSLAADIRADAALDRLLEFRKLSVGKRGQQGWIDQLRITGLLLACLTDEEYLIVCQSAKNHWTAAPRRAKLSTSTQEKAKPQHDF